MNNKQKYNQTLMIFKTHRATNKTKDTHIRENNMMQQQLVTILIIHCDNANFNLKKNHGNSETSKQHQLQHFDWTRLAPRVGG